jgi:subtilisin-like proprotein convertase family protein
VDASRAAVTVTLPASPGAPYTAELPWTINAAGYRFHNWYGFGAVDVDAAVAMATGGYANLPAFADTGWLTSGSITLAIPNASAVGATSAIAVPATPKNLSIEAVQISVKATHPYPGDLGIELTSPSGTKSILLNIRNGFNTANLAGMVLASNAFYGEGSAGTWTIKVVDGDSSHGAGTLTNWRLRIYGH